MAPPFNRRKRRELKSLKHCALPVSNARIATVTVDSIFADVFMVNSATESETKSMEKNIILKAATMLNNLSF